MNKPFTRPYHLIIVLISLALIGFNVARIVKVSITHDEVQTYYLFVTKSYEQIISNYRVTANNHFLNSILAKLSINTFGDSLFFLRMPNLLAQLIYLVFSFLIVNKLFRKGVWIICAFLLLQVNPFLFDFWGLCRGYGLSIAFMSGCIYFLLCYLEHTRSSPLFLCIFLLCCSIYSNLSLLNFTMGVLLIIALQLALKRSIILAGKALIIISALGTCMGLLLAKPIKDLREKGQLFYGGEDFARDTVGSLIHESFYLEGTEKISYLVAVFIIAICLLAGIYWCMNALKGKKLLNTGVALWLLLIVPALSVITQYHLLGTKYVMDRTALFFYPLFVLMISYTLMSIETVPAKLNKILLVVLTTGNLINFGVNLNFISTRTWYFDAHTPWLMERMIEEKKNKGEIKIYLDWLLTPSLKYYTERKYPGRFGYLEGQNEMAYDALNYDFYLGRPWGLKDVPAIFELDTVFNKGEYYMYRRKNWDNDTATLRVGFSPRMNW